MSCSALYLLVRDAYIRLVFSLIAGYFKLSCNHPLVYQQFNRRHFAVKNRTGKFSGISEEQAHKQKNKSVKIDGGTIGILDHTARMKWMIAGSEISRILPSFDVVENRTEEDAPHHGDTDSH